MDATLDRLLALDGAVFELGNEHWAKIAARKVPVTPERPHGVAYSLCLFRGEERILCYDNAHPVAVGSGPAKRRTAVNDHTHKGVKVKPYRYTNAESLLVDFWKDVYHFLGKEDVL